jgi:hypothetical protein
VANAIREISEFEQILINEYMEKNVAFMCMSYLPVPYIATMLSMDIFITMHMPTSLYLVLFNCS